MNIAKVGFRYFILLMVFAIGFQVQLSAQNPGKPGPWGDQLNGTYKNPVLNADYSDPDVIRVGDTFYMVCSDFHFMGIPVLSSKDLVNWTIVSQVYKRLDISDQYNSMDRYGGGSWAPSIRYHDGKFYVYFCTPDEGLYMSTATNATGPWAPLTQVIRTSGWEDPCPFWDGDGQAYLGHSKLGAGPIIIHKMSKDGKTLLDEGVTVYEGPTAEGTKIYKRNGYYYIIIPEGGVGTGYQTALRAKNLYGPYERKVVLEQGSTSINGPHQGGLVDALDGTSWFMHFQSVGALGRVCHLQPVKWVNDWPLMGVDYDKNGIGEPVESWQKPKAGKSAPAGKRVVVKATFPQTSDEFNGTKLGLQWQWNHNPVDSKWSLRRYKGFLALEAMKADDNKRARNTITQKLMGKSAVFTALLRADQMKEGQKAGLCLIGGNIHEIGLMKIGNAFNLFADNNGKMTRGVDVQQSHVYLRAIVDLNDRHNQLQYSLDGKTYINLGGACELSDNNYWKAVRPALFSYGKQDGGVALFDWWRVQ